MGPEHVVSSDLEEEVGGGALHVLAGRWAVLAHRGLFAVFNIYCLMK